MRVVDEEGRQVGVLPVYEAIKRAQEVGLDLVEVAPDANPPVARIMDFSKFKYEQEKKEREAKKKQHVIHTKEIKMGPKIEAHDYQFKMKHIEDFLKRGDKVKVTMMFRGREMMHVDIGRNVLNKLASDLSAVGELETGPTMEGRIMGMVFRPKK